jgi:AraC-like DNA-binding protein/dienelactone hydrolase
MDKSREISMDQDFIRKLTNTVFDYLNNEQFGAEELSSQIGLSRSQIHRRLHQINGQSITQFIREIRLKEAHRLLENNAGTASEIAYEVGFGSPTYFNKCFHEYYGYTPGEVKKKVNLKLNYSKTQYGKPKNIRWSQKRKPLLATVAAAVLVLIIYTGWSIHRKNRIRWATYQALPEIERLLKEPRYTESYNLALKAEKYIPENTELKDLFIRVSSSISIITDPSGAEIYIKEYTDIDGDWKFIGRSPIYNIRLPINFYRWKLDKKGYEPVLAVLNPKEDTLFRKLDKSGSLPPGMVRVIGSMSENGEIPDFFIDQYEVTNRQYKGFIDDKGYQNKTYWKHPIVQEGMEITWEEAMKLFRDETGRLGPAFWRAGDYPDGQDDFPVSGISWYEAAAYAEYTGKVLPTSDHWNIAAGFHIRSIRSSLSKIIALSNFDGKGTVAKGTKHGIDYFGAGDMAGNVREWCWNKTEVGRVIKGGAWDDKEYLYHGTSQLPPCDRSSKNGFRCAKYDDRSKIPDKLFQPLKYEPYRNFYTEVPATDEIFEILKSNYSYENKNLDTKIEFQPQETKDYEIEIVSYSASYGNDRIIASLYLPKNIKPPYQTIIFFPGGGAIKKGEIINNTHFKHLKFLVKNGRALIIPAYFGTYDRFDSTTAKIMKGERSIGYIEIVEKLIKDIRRSIDYLETREDIDNSKIGYFGVSWGARLGLIIPAVEDRIKVSVLALGGLPKDLKSKKFAPIDELNYITRIYTPVLMLNGRYDYIFPYEITIKPAYDLLGTSKKKLRTYDTDHFVPLTEFMKESLIWLDEHLGPVDKNINEGSSLISRY